MSENKRRILLTFGYVAPLALLIVVGVLYAVTKEFAFNAAMHMIVRMLVVLVIVRIFRKAFKDQITKSLGRTTVLCAAVLFADLAAVDAVRYILSGGTSTVLFLPACLPLCFMIVMHYSAKDTGRDKASERRLSYIVGIPLLALSLYFEVLSFVQL